MLFVQLMMDVVIWMLGGRVLFEWVTPRNTNRIAQLAIKATEPMLRPVRRFVPRVGEVDLTPIVILTLIVIVRLTVFPPDSSILHFPQPVEQP